MGTLVLATTFLDVLALKKGRMFVFPPPPSPPFIISSSRAAMLCCTLFGYSASSESLVMYCSRTVGCCCLFCAAYFDPVISCFSLPSSTYILHLLLCWWALLYSSAGLFPLLTDEDTARGVCARKGHSDQWNTFFIP